MNKQQLANRIWASANNMRNKIDANEYKDYILGLIFYKFLSDTEVKYFVEDCEWEEDELVELVENYDDMNMKNAIAECQEHIGFFIEYKYLFNTWLTDTEFSVATLSEALSSFERLMSQNFAAVYDGIFKTLREGLSKLGENPSAQTKALKGLIKLIKDIPTDGSQDYDVLGYVYEYLISNFAANAGKKAGEFYTPHEVAMVMSEIVAEHHKDKESLEIYDPTSGSGSLLITIGKAVSKHIKGKNKVKYYAQELKENTYNLTRMNLVLRGIIPQNIVTRCADTLEEDWPIHEEGSEIDKPLAVDAVVSNPPYSQHWDPTNKEMDARFAQYGMAPKTKADYAFLLHELHHLKSDGILTIVLPHGVLFRGKAPKLFDKNGKLLPIEEREEGQAEGQIRANLIEKNNIDAIIGLPANIFFGTGIPTLIMVLKKNRGDEGVLIIDASKGFVKDGKQNRLRASDVKKIADTYRERKSIEGYSRVVSRDEIRRIAPLPLVDKYAAYQILADHWQDIMGDVEIIQTEGMGACNVVEPKYKMVKDKNGVEQEVPDGEKGRIMPFALIQHIYFQTELDALAALADRIETINGEVDAIKENFTEDEQEVYLDAEKDGAIDKNKVKADSKPKADIEPETKEKLKQIVNLWDEQAKKKKQLTKETLELLAKTKEKIESLDMHEINRLLDKKWIEPVVSAISAMPDAIIATLADTIGALAEKYAVTYHDIENDLASSQQTLAELVGQLTGDEFAIKGLTELIKG